MKKFLFILFLQNLLFCFGQTNDSSRQSDVSSKDPNLRLYLLSNLDGIQLVVPREWKDRIKGQLSRQPLELEFTGQSGDSFRLGLTLIGRSERPIPKITPIQLKMEISRAAEIVKSNLVEKLIEIQEIKGSSGFGYYFFSTDRSREIGENRKLTVGLYFVDEVLISFTVMTNDAEREIVPQVLSMIKTATYLERSSILGCATAKNNRDVAYKYEVGEENSKRDLDKALQYYRISAEQGDPEAQYRLALVYSERQSEFDMQQEIRLCMLAAEKGHAEAAARLGHIYWTGRRTTKNMTQAVKWTQVAAMQGVAIAMSELGQYYIDGDGISKDYQQALKWLRMGAQTGNDEALFRLGAVYYNGEAVPRDFAEGNYWSYKAALAGNKEAMTLLDELDVISTVPQAIFEENKIKNRLLTEEFGNVLALNVGDSSNKVVELFGLPVNPNSCGFGEATDIDTVKQESEIMKNMNAKDLKKYLIEQDQKTWTTIWKYTNGWVYLKGGKIIQNGITQLTKEGQGKVLTSGKLYDLRAFPFINAKNPKYWPLAASALLTEYNSRRHDLLGGEMPTKENARAQMWNLYYWWGVSSRESLLDKMSWLQKQGDRSEFKAIAKTIDTMTPARINVLIQTNPDIAFVAKNKSIIGKKSLIGWDYVRYILLCRWGFLAGYLSEDEAWARMMPVARVLQKTFESWDDLSKNYLVGRQFIKMAETSSEADRMQKVYDKLLNGRLSPWKLCFWGMDLCVSDSTLNDKLPE